MTQQQTQQEYHNCIITPIEMDELEYKSKRERIKILRRIRSRPLSPHTSSTEAQAVRIHKILFENRDDIISRLSESFSPETIEEMRDISRKHDAAIRNATLDELYTSFNVSELTGKETDYELGFRQGMTHAQCTIKSLRKQEEP